MKRLFSILLLAAVLCGWSASVLAARQYTIAQTNPIPPGQFDMGSTQTLTFRVTNTSNGGNAGERVYEMRFRLPGTGTVFSAPTAAPAGWTRTAFSTTSVTFRATSWANSILSGSFLDFNLVMVMRTTTVDVNETLRDARARFTLDTNFANGITRSGTVTINNPGSWQLKSLQITSFQTTDTGGTPVSAIVSGASFRVVITVRNISSATQNGIVANPSPPTQTRGGTWGSLSTNCSLTGTSPSPLNLVTGASGTITYTCTTVPADNGTVTFSVTNVRNGANTATSRTATSNTITVSPVTVSMSITPTTPSCLFSGNSATMTLRATNTTSGTITNVTPSGFTLTTANGASTSGLTGPSPASVASLAPGAFQDFVWTATVTGAVPLTGAKPSITASSAISYQAGGPVLTTAQAPDTEDVDDYLVSLSPASVNASSTNEELTWTVTNRGCANVNSVAVTVPGGWTYGGDSYSLVTDTTLADIETWNLGTTFTAPLNNAPLADPGRMPLGQDGQFMLVFSTMPATTGSSTFTVRVTDENGTFVDKNTLITINPFGTGGNNDTSPGPWREEFR